MSKADSIKAKIKNIAIKESKSYDYLLMHYLIERVLYRISISAYSENFILKGGLLLYCVLSNDARATKDIDFLAIQIRNSLEEVKEAFVDICSISCDDAVNYDITSINAERIKEDADYEGIRIKLVSYLGERTRHILQFDIGFGDVIIPKPLDMNYPTVLDMEKAKIKVYSLESVIAEKFEAMIYLSEANSRMKDFYDIYTLCKTFNFDGVILHEAISKTFIRRSTTLIKTPTIFTNEFYNLIEKKKQWKGFLKRIQIKNSIEFKAVMELIMDFLQPIYQSIIDENEFSGHWACKELSWRLKL